MKDEEMCYQCPAFENICTLELKSSKCKQFKKSLRKYIVKKIPGFGEVAAVVNRYYKGGEPPDLPVFGQIRVCYNYILNKIRSHYEENSIKRHG